MLHIHEVLGFCTADIHIYSVWFVFLSTWSFLVFIRVALSSAGSVENCYLWMYSVMALNYRWFDPAVLVLNENVTRRISTRNTNLKFARTKISQIEWFFIYFCFTLNWRHKIVRLEKCFFSWLTLVAAKNDWILNGYSISRTQAVTQRVKTLIYANITSMFECGECECPMSAI